MKNIDIRSAGWSAGLRPVWLSLNRDLRSNSPKPLY